MVSLTAVVLDDSGAEVSDAPVEWTASDTLLAKDAGAGRFTLLRPGTTRITARSGSLTGTYDLVIGRLVVKRVDLTPGSLDLGRGDRVQVTARLLGQGDRAITNRTVTFTSDNRGRRRDPEARTTSLAPRASSSRRVPDRRRFGRARME